MIDFGGAGDTRAGRKLVGCCSINRLRSRASQSFRRTWGDIRDDGADVAVLCFVRRGLMRMVHECGESLAAAGDLVVARSTTPFTIECFPGDGGTCEMLHLTVPMHMLRRVLRDDIRAFIYIPATNRKLGVAERVLTALFEDVGELREQVAQQLLEAALSVLGDAARSDGCLMPVRRSLVDRRLHEVLRYVEMHLSDPKLSATAVARECGISPRYLSKLLSRNGTPFPTLVWSKRLEAAEQWLAHSKAGAASISEIAYRVGFKSPAHFSRMFKREFKLSPRQYRAGSAPRHGPHAGVVNALPPERNDRTRSAAPTHVYADRAVHPVAACCPAR